MDIKNVAVLGAGTMGRGITEVVARAGYQVRLQDVESQSLELGRRAIAASMDRMVAKGKLTAEERDAALGRIQTCADAKEAVREADLVIEAITEDLDLKRKLFKDLADWCAEHTILASNTSQLSITSIAAATSCPQRVIGTHWFNPPQVMRLVEIAMGLATSRETVTAVQEFCDSCGKQTVVCQDAQGFITSRSTVPHVLESLRLLEDGVAPKEEIDKAVKLAFNYPMGPFELIDMVGLDTFLFTCLGLEKAYGERFKPPQILIKLVEAGRLGRKTGQGFYTYE